MGSLEALRKEAIQSIRKAEDAAAVEATRVLYLGRKDGRLTAVLRGLKSLSLEEKRKVGPEANKLRQELEEEVEKRQREVADDGGEKDFDPTMPGVRVRYGSAHPLTIIQERIAEIFTAMNFSVVEGPEVETEHYNFDALNIPVNHPAREMWDTFWLRSNQKETLTQKGERLLMRTHTSPVQIRFMEKNKPPFQVIAPGRVFRYEATDASHEINFHQVEGLAVGREVSLANFKYVIEEFLNAFFGTKLQFRFRPSYFPFTEPSVEVDIKIKNSIRQLADKNQNEGKWLEVMGAGMVHPEVLKGVGIDPKEWQGFAFGMGVERLAMLKHGIPDIRMFYEGDLRFVRQF